MKTKAIVLDRNAVEFIESMWEPPTGWFENFSVKDEKKRLRSIRNDEVVFLLSDDATVDSRLLIISLEPSNFFLGLSSENRSESFRRIRRAALSAFSKIVDVPYSWRPFKSGSRISFMSNRRSANEYARVSIDQHPFGTNHVYLFSFSEGKEDLSALEPDRKLFQLCVTDYKSVVHRPIASDIDTNVNGSHVVELEETPPFFEYAATPLRTWYDSRFTKAQRKFVDAAEDRSLRLKGAPGTGKTVALTAKFLQSIYSRLVLAKPFSLLFLTHSSGTAVSTKAFLDSMDERRALQAIPAESRVAVQTLLETANEHMEGHLLGLDPISLDALDGRKMQLELIESLIDQYLLGDWAAKRFACSEGFKSGMLSTRKSKERRRFSWELMNEFACVLDAEAVRSVADKRKRYLNGQRSGWMMPLTSLQERQVVLALYDRFREELRSMNVISVDQLIADFIGFLDSNRWDVLRATKGYDAIFVDELHLFNREERMVFQSLMRDPNKPPVVFMAYDAKQAPYDTFVGLVDSEELQGAYWSTLGIGAVQKIELDEVFRYTPEISAFLQHLEQTFPAVDLGADWNPYLTTTQNAPGDVPTVSLFPSTEEAYKNVFQRASALKKSLGRDGTVAVLTCNQDEFSTYLEAGLHREKFIPAKSREEAGAVRRQDKKYLVSMPEYVAGLQFDVVLLLDVNESEAPSGPYASSAKRKFLSQIYLGASRAKRTLEIFANKDAGGISTLLNLALRHKTLVETKFAELAQPRA